MNASGADEKVYRSYEKILRVHVERTGDHPKLSCAPRTFSCIIEMGGKGGSIRVDMYDVLIKLTETFSCSEL